MVTVPRGGGPLWYLIATAIAAGAMAESRSAESVSPPGTWSIPTALAGQKRGMTIEDEMGIRDIKVAHVSPDGRQVLFQVNQADVVANAFRSAWFVASARAGARAQFLADAGQINLLADEEGSRVGDVVERPAAWSPDGQWIAFARDDQHAVQIWRISIDGQKAEQVTHNAADIIEFAWSEDGSRILYTVGRDRVAAADATQKEGLRGYLYDGRMRPDYPTEMLWSRCIKVRFRSGGDSHSCDPIVWVADIASGTEQRATEQEIGLFRALRQPDSATRLWEGEDIQWSTPSPDGKRVAWLTNPNPKEYSGVDPPMAVIVSSTPDHAAGVLCPYEQCVGSIQGLWWNRASTEVVFLRREGHRHSVMAFYAWRPGHDAPRRLLSSDSYFRECNVARDRLICIREDWTHPAYIVTMDMSNGAMQTVVDLNPEFEKLMFTPIEKIEWTDENGNAALGHLVYPAGYRRGHRYPLVVVSYTFNGYMKSVGDEHAIFPMAQQGFAVLFYSIPFTEQTKKIADFKTMAAANWSTSRASALYWVLDRLGQRGLIDPQRVGVSGLSNGATMVDEAILNTHRFAAASAGYSNTHPVSYYLLPTQLRATSRLVSGGEPMAGGLAYWQTHSPGLNADKVNTPLLLNVADREVMLAVANYASLEDAGRPVEMYVFPDEYHVKWQPAHKYNVYLRNMQWFQFWLQDKEVNNPVDTDQYLRWRKLRELQCKNQRSLRDYCDHH